MTGCALDQQSIAPGARSPSFGAFYVQSNDGNIYGMSYDYGSQAAAQARAERECSKQAGSAGHCIPGAWFENACGALAVSPNNGWGSDWGNNEQEAQQKALTVCKNSAGQECSVKWVQCSGR